MKTNTEYSREYRAKNPERVREYARRWQAANPDKARQYRLKRQKANQEANHLWKKANPERAALIERRSKLKRAYGLSLEQYDQLLKDQNFCCAVCDKTNEQEIEDLGTRLVVDHNHTTNVVRGLLCRSCNRFLIRNHDTPAIFYRAAEYLKKES